MIATALLVLAGCADPDPRELYGTWQSNESLTLVQVGAAAGLTAEQRQMFEEPGFWGHLRVTYEPGRMLSEFEDSRAYSPYRVVRAAGGTVDIEHMDPLTGDVVVMTLIIDGDELWVPVLDLGFYEIFTRVR